MPLPKNYNSKEHEDRIYTMWEDSGAFQPVDDPKATPYCIIMPPPNATGQLHLGHAMMLAIEDALIRHHRMLGDATLWLPGTDHSAIATHAKVEKMVIAEGSSRERLGHEKFVQRIKEYVVNSQDTIRSQVRKMGSSCDWTREKYTMDVDVSAAVRKMFVDMYNDGLIYRGHRIVNWCPHCASTLANDEVEYKKEKTKFYYFTYGPVVIGTARPETKFADKVIIVHPDDKRFADMVGKEFDVPWIEGTVKARVIADEVADPELGSGAMTITPAHSFLDFDLAQKYGLEVKQIIDERGNLTEEAGGFAGKNANMARAEIVAKMQEKGLVHHIDEDYEHNLSICYRCGTAIEPLVSNQWFVDVNKKVMRWGGNQKKKSLKDVALEVVHNGEINIIPKRFDKVYFHWMENLHDWCISRQIWWGHPLPVWQRQSSVGSQRSYDDNAKSETQNAMFAVTSDADVRNVDAAEETYVGLEPPEGEGWVQDTDTLDTWFSAGMWTFSTLGWPASTNDLHRFHPTDVLETGYDILFFWVARMILMTTYGTHEVPFRDVYLHGLVRDKQGRKMSKSLGNGIDPVEMIAKYGADAVRLSLIIGTTPGNDIRLYEEKIEGYRNFANKIWNIARYVERELGEGMAHVEKKTGVFDYARCDLFDKWILSRLHTLVREVTEDIESYRLSSAAERIFQFTWSEFADWYIETTKARSDDQTKLVLYGVLENVLRLLHPFMPFVTEVLWEGFPIKEKLITSTWPKANEEMIDADAERTVGMFQEVVKEIRVLRNIADMQASTRGKVAIRLQPIAGVVRDYEGTLKKLGGVGTITWLGEGEETPKGLSAATSAGEVLLLVAQDDLTAITKKLGKERAQLEKYVAATERKLNSDFSKKAPETVVRETRGKLAEAQEKLRAIVEQLERL